MTMPSQSACCPSQVLQTIGEHRLLKPDSLQRLHALHNLASLLSEKGQRLPQGCQHSHAGLVKEADSIREVRPCRSQARNPLRLTLVASAGQSGATDTTGGAYVLGSSV